MKHKDASAYAQNFEAVADLLRQNGTIVLNRGAEIGVRQGFFSKHLLITFPDLEMRLVDPFAPYQDVDKFYTKEDQEALRKECMKRLAAFAARTAYYFEPSIVAAEHVPACSLDFVFIDAEHTYEAALADCLAWLPKVRTGGVLCGHDYEMPEVRMAVDEMAGRLGNQVGHIGLPADVWYMGV
jgi:hypothetical protein